MIIKAWKHVSTSTIINCWNHANIIREDLTEETIQKKEVDKVNSDIEKNRLIDDVAKFLSQFAYQLKCETLDVLEYIKIEDDHPTGDNLTDEDIIALVKSTRKDLEIEEEVEIKKTEELKVITHKEALASYENLNYLENNILII